jgi:hypothetical protein
VKISLIKSIMSRFWRRSRESPEIRRSRYARCNGVSTPNKKLHGREKKN